MRWSSRAGRLPNDVRSALSLGRGDHILAQAPTLDGSFVVATTGALYLPDGQGDFLRLPWERIGQASWREGHLHVREQGPDAPEYEVGFTDPGSVPEIVQERITATIVISHYAELPSGGGVRVVGRRGLLPAKPTVQGTTDLHWSFVFDPGLDPTDPALLTQAEAVLENLRLQTGL
jgi:hypothetical protein